MAAFRSDVFANKRILIVGCAQGHGLSVAEGCAANGAEVLLVDRNPAVLEAAVRIIALGGKASVRVTDVTQAGAVKTAFDELAEDKGFDGLIYLPRGRVRKNWEELTSEDWDADLNIALKGAFLSAQAAVPHLRGNSRQSFIVTLSSILAEFIGNEGLGYHAAKGGLESLTRYLAVQLGPQGIRVNAIQMGWIIKEQDAARFAAPENLNYRNSAIKAHPLRRVGDATDLINSILFLGSEKAAFITGQVLRLDGGLTLQEQTHFLSRMSSSD